MAKTMSGAKLHPLDQLTGTEIRAVAAACRAKAEELGLPHLRFNTITNQEPSKAGLLRFEADPSVLPARVAFCILQAPPTAPVIEALVDVSDPASPAIQSWTKRTGAEPSVSLDDCFEIEAIFKADPGVQKLLAARGVTDMDLVACDPWSINVVPHEGRIVQSFLYLRSSPDDNQYAHPIDFVPLLDLNSKQVIAIDEPYGDSPPPIPKQDANYHHKLAGKPRTGIKPLDVIQPEGPSFQVDGSLITWQKWQIRISFNYREGLVLHNVGYEDGGRVRPILHRASLVEMAVPYGDPRPPFHRKCAFDAGDIGLGYAANSLALGCDCLGAIHYFDALFADSKGEPFELPKAVCLHEEDAGLLWKHMDYRTGHTESRRSRRLVISFIATVVNYEYLFYWYFYQDGSIQFEVKLTGELSTSALSPGETEPGFGTLVAPGVNAQHHQHQFCARLDFALDDAQGGAGLAVTEVNVEALPEGPKNPFGNAFKAVETTLETEKQAHRDIKPETARMWKVINPQAHHPVTGKPVAYKLMPEASPLLLAQPSSMVSRRAGFAKHSLWVTPHTEGERWPAGDYTLCSSGGAGLEAYTSKDRSVAAGSDPVLWHTFGVTHIPRPEDYPIMPVEHTGFMLKPVGFFNGNPSTDLPAGRNTASVLANGCCKSALSNGNGHAKPYANGETNGHANGQAVEE